MYKLVQSKLKKLWLIFPILFLFYYVLNSEEENCHKDVYLRKNWKTKPEKVIFQDSVSMNQPKAIYFDDELNIRFKQSIIIEKIEIYNYIGSLEYQAILNQFNDNFIFKSLYLNRGIYFIKVYSKKRNFLLCVFV